jgi:hypothetical protein
MKTTFPLRIRTPTTMGRKQRVKEMMKAVMMMMVTSLQMEPKYRAQMKQGYNRLQTKMLMA